MLAEAAIVIPKTPPVSLTRLLNRRRSEDAIESTSVIPTWRTLDKEEGRFQAHSVPIPAFLSFVAGP
jgi:hypothetical protein